MRTIVAQAISGGMDSTALLLHHLARGREVSLLSFNYGQKHHLELERLDANLVLLAKTEWPVAHRRLTIPLGQVADSALTVETEEVPEGFYEEENMKATVVPNRNAVLASFVFAHALTLKVKNPDTAVGVSLGVHSGDHAIYPDCREDFFSALHAAFQGGNWGGENIGLLLPFLHLDKAHILRGALDDCEVLGLDFDEVFANTNTSYAPTPEGLASGRTGSDVERILAFHEIGRVDPVRYVGGWGKALEEALSLEKNFHAASRASN